MTQLTSDEIVHIAESAVNTVGTTGLKSILS